MRGGGRVAGAFVIENGLHLPAASRRLNLAVGFNPLSLPKLFQFKSYARAIDQIV